ncbi:MAG: hypothetical protein DBY05_12830 [Clostridiales bacterium]|nr:MAG: hypothetical protein DBY05_12830 [Clostridiales bacterium]
MFISVSFAFPYSLNDGKAFFIGGIENYFAARLLNYIIKRKKVKSCALTEKNCRQAMQTR